MRPWLPLFLAPLTVAAVGCKPIAYVFQPFAPKSEAPAHKLQDVPTVVFVDDPQARLPSERTRERLAKRITVRLRKKEVVETLVPPRRVARKRASHEDFSEWSIDRVGEAVAAEQVIYVFVGRFEPVGRDRMYRPTSTLRVKVVDTSRGERRFPEQEAGRSVTTELFYQEREEGTGAGRLRISRKLARRAARDVARLFYRHEPPKPTVPE